MKYSQLVKYLRTKEYFEEQRVSASGDFLIQGDIITVWPVTSSEIYRIHYFGEEVEKIESKELGSDKWQACAKDIEWIPNWIETENGIIRPGDYVVHPYHGIGVFEGISTREVDKVFGQYASLLYANNDKILFPNLRFNELMPYYGARKPRLTRLYSKVWKNTKEKIQKDLIKVSRDLIKLYSDREEASRDVYHFNFEWHSSISSGVDFDLTPDQAKAWSEILHDLTKRKNPMDRLICGDVGFGKTELAIRTAAQVLASGKQVALIAPTTVLAEQHFALIQRRFEGLPVRVEHLSRINKGNSKEIVKDLAEGRVDLVVGTHRLLGRDVQFKDLGLLIVDEEQKFGVEQKEKIRKLKPHLDTLSLSATPIPRTLYMTISGLRGLSILNTAPKGRLPVETKVEPYNDQSMRDALQFELDRGGQVYVIHNRVMSLSRVYHKVQDLLNQIGYKALQLDSKMAIEDNLEANHIYTAMAHGQMDEVALAKTMSAFLGGRIKVLVASSIVENGLDCPQANTLLVIHSERFGLSDLYQLRGRVGRRNVQSKAFFFTGGIDQAEEILDQVQIKVTDRAKKRLSILEEAQTLGSGWEVALRDMEIRGGGNILGHEQHGNMEAIGLLLYAQLLREEIGKQARRLGVKMFQHYNEIETS